MAIFKLKTILFDNSLNFNENMNIIKGTSQQFTQSDRQTSRDVDPHWPYAPDPR